MRTPKPHRFVYRRYEQLTESGRWAVLTLQNSLSDTEDFRMGYREYVVDTTVSGDHVLDDWRWLTGSPLQLWHVTKAGDALLRDPTDGSIHFLDVIAGSVERIAEGDSDFESAVATPENAERWLMPDIVNGQAALGMRPERDECLSFKKPPVLGGQLEPDNFETCDVLVHFSIAGQIHRQVKDLPPGTKIGKLQIKEPGGQSKGPWWKLW
jgi:Domain of unknown function (DUF1851)